MLRGMRCEAIPGFVKWIVAGALVAAALRPWAWAGSYEAVPAERRKEMQREVRLVIGAMENEHLGERAIVEMEPKAVLDAYLSALDPWRLVFLAGDEKFIRRRFEKTLASSYLLSGDIYPAFEIHDVFRERWAARLDWIAARIEQPFDPANDETWDAERPEDGYPKTQAGADAAWERMLAAWVIAGRLGGRSEGEVRAALERRVRRWRRDLAAADLEAIEERFLDAWLGSCDPHSGFESWDTALDLEVDLSGSLAGVGTEIERIGGEVVIVHVTPGGPAEASGEVAAGDRLVAVGTEAAAMEPVQHLRLREIVKRLRGEPGTRVRLSVRSEDEEIVRTVDLVRRRIAVESARASGLVFDLGDTPKGGKAGVIVLPSFYGERTESGGVETSAADDVAEILGKFKEQGVGGVVLDLRDNPGGRLDEAVRVAGHFIDHGPVVLLATGEGGPGTKPAVQGDETRGLAWAGPLVVLTSARSASASELVAGALQAYGRAVVVGAERTFGKGTSQLVMPLREAAERMGVAAGEHFGVVRVTGQMFFLPNGASTQLRGVVPDIVVPFVSGAADEGEAGLKGALPWKELAVPDFAVARKAAVPEGVGLGEETRARLIAAAEARERELPEFAWHRRRMAWHRARWAGGAVSLNLERRRAAKEAIDAERRAIVEERQALARELDFPWTVTELDAVVAQQSAEAEAAGSRASYRRGLFRTRDAGGGRWRELRVGELDFEYLAEEREELAAALAEAAGASVDARGFQAACLAAQEEEYDRAGVFERRIAALTGIEAGTDGARAVLEALFARVVDMEPRLAGRPAHLDVTLREGLRVVLEWRDLGSPLESDLPNGAPAPNPR
jgi:carboxyl-terminal processing protease